MTCLILNILTLSFFLSLSLSQRVDGPRVVTKKKCQITVCRIISLWLWIVWLMFRSRIFPSNGVVTTYRHRAPKPGIYYLWSGRELVHAMPAVTCSLSLHFQLCKYNRFYPLLFSLCEKIKIVVFIVWKNSFVKSCYVVHVACTCKKWKKHPSMVCS